MISKQSSVNNAISIVPNAKFQAQIVKNVKSDILYFMPTNNVY